MSQAENATANAGHPLNLFDLESAVPDANTLLSLKLLKEANGKAFEGLAERSTIWLASALALLRKDKFLRIKFGGDNINAAMQLAPILKRRAEEKHIQARMDSISGDLMNIPFNTGLTGLGPLAPSKILTVSAGGEINLDTSAASNKAMKFDAIA